MTEQSEVNNNKYLNRLYWRACLHLTLAGVSSFLMGYAWLKGDNEFYRFNNMDGYRFYAMGGFYMILSLIQIKKLIGVAEKVNEYGQEIINLPI